MIGKAPAFLLCVSLAALADGVSAAGIPGYSDIGGVNLTYYCATTFGSGFKSVLIGSTAGDWRCQRPKSKDLKSISVEAACGLQYGRTGLKAKALDWNNAGSWRCFAPLKPK